MKRTVFAYPYIVWMLLFILAPMLLIIWYAFSKDGSFTLANLTTALKDPIYMQVLLRSVWIAFKATVICLVLGAMGIANMWLAIFADVGVMIIAVLNAIRALFVKKL